MIDAQEVTYIFKSKWKEELICSCDLGEFCLEFVMGVPTVYLPTENQWQNLAPVWAGKHWQSLHCQLQAWCHAGGFGLVLDETATVIF
jgi:hypothetical protein